MYQNDLELARIHIAELMTEAENERLARTARGNRAPRPVAARPIGRVAVMVGVAIVLALRALPGTIQ